MKTYRIASWVPDDEILNEWNNLKGEMSGITKQPHWFETLARHIKETKSQAVIDYVFENIDGFKEGDIILPSLLKNPLSAQHVDKIIELMERYGAREDESLRDIWILFVKDPDMKFRLIQEFMVEKEDPSKHKIEEVKPLGKGVEELESLIANGNNWYRMADQYQKDQEAISKLTKSLEVKYPGLSLFVWENDMKIYVNEIRLPKEMRNQGIGTAVMKEIQNYAQSVNKPVVLHPSPDSRKKQPLYNFYENLGFVHNKGRKMDYRLSEPFAHTMYWRSEKPKENIASRFNWYRLAQGKPWEMTQQEFMDYHNTGFISPTAYKQYSTVEGMNWLKKSDYPILYSTKIFGGHNIEFRKSGEKLQYTALDADGEILRGSDGLALMMSDEEVMKKGYPTEDMTIVAFDGDIAIGWSSDEFGTDGVWVVKDYQGVGIGTYLLSELRKQHEPERKIGQMTSAGYEMSKSYHRQSVKEAIENGLLTPDNPKYNDIIKNYPDLALTKTASIKYNKDKRTSEDTWKLIKELERGKTESGIWNKLQFLASDIKNTTDDKIIQYMLKSDVITRFPTGDTMFTYILKNPLSWQHPEALIDAMDHFWFDHTIESENAIKYWVSLVGDLDLKIKLGRRYGVIEKEDPSKHKFEEIPKQKGKGVEELESLLANENSVYRIAKSKMDSSKMDSKQIRYLLSLVYMKVPIGIISDGALKLALSETNDEEIIKDVLDSFSAYFCLNYGVLQNPLSWKYPHLYRDKVINLLEKLRPKGGSNISRMISEVGDLDFKFELAKKFNLIEQEDPSLHKIEEVPDQSGKGTEELESLLAKNKNWYKTANRVVMYHHTAPENVFLIEQNGLKINQEWGKTQGAQIDIERIYGLRPIFLTSDPNKFKGANDVTLEIDVTGLDLVADIPSLYDFGGYYGDNNEGIWWDENGVPLPLIDYVDENGMLYYDDLLNPNSPVTKVCIELTKTAACENSIEPQRIKVLGNPK